MCAFKALVLVFHWWFVICCDLISSCKHVALGQTMWFVQGTLLYEANTHTHTHTHTLAGLLAYSQLADGDCQSTLFGAPDNQVLLCQAQA